MNHWFNEIVDAAIDAIYYNYDVKKAHEAMENLQKAADNGDADAMYLLARCYGGKDFCWVYFDFPEDYSLMKKYMENSILHGSAAGVIGSMRSGMLTEELEEKMPFSSIKEAWNEIYAKAKAGCAFCQNMIGNTYYWLDIVRIDNVEADDFPDEESWVTYLSDMVIQSISWYEKAFNNRMGFSGRNLVTLYEKGGHYEVIKPTPHKAIEVEKLGAELGYPEWKEKYGTRLIETGEDEYRGVELCREAAKEGQKIGWYEVANAYQRGGAYPIDYAKSLEAAENGIGWSKDFNCCEIATMLYMDDYEGVPQNYKRAVFLLNRIKAQGLDWYKDRLAFCYAQGLGCEQNIDEAIDLINELIENEDEEDTRYIRYTLGFLHANGLGTKKNISKAIKLWKLDEHWFNPSKEALQQYRRTWYGKWVKK